MNLEEIQKLSDKDLFIKVAELVGWHGIQFDERFGGDGAIGMYGPTRGFLPIPNYVEDLNAMHKAELYLNHEQAFEYTKNLQYLMADQIEKDCDGQKEPTPIRSMGMVYASARQRAQAFVLTLQKE